MTDIQGVLAGWEEARKDLSEFVESGGWDVIKMSDGGRSAVPMDTANALAGIVAGQKVADALRDSEMQAADFKGERDAYMKSYTVVSAALRHSQERETKLRDEMARQARRADLAADVVRGIPAFMSMWSTLDGIANDLARSLASSVGLGDEPAA